MWAHLDRHGLCEKKCAGLVRVFEDGVKFGEPYRWACAVEFWDESTVELVGISGRAPTPSEARAGLRLMRQCGLRVVGLRRSGARPGMRDVTRERV